ncbi:MAG: DNA-3-methyladenine glycosylase I [Gemmatimonadaceae bacterium]|nr:DNA-3-methyladenine glycosylase I [Gemmatimonadaceae bacterium]MCW5827004.1 DNA-3-methyladenine glycosylase I [Gemmatimonadaceae bacterium]
MKRCWWCGDDALYVRYHDVEWGVPVTEDIVLFEKLALEGFQAGLSWITILRKRERFREVFQGFSPDRVAAFRERDLQRLLRDPGIIRHRGKIEAVIGNARAYRELVAREGSLARFAWSFAPALPRVPRARGDIPAQTVESEAFSKELKRRGWRFVGPTTAYAFFQAMGLVNDHLADCHRQSAVATLRARVLASGVR